MNFSSTEVFESTKFPGVTVRLRRMSASRRAEFNLKFADLLKKSRDLYEERSAIEDQWSEHLKAIDVAKEAGAEAPEFPAEKWLEFLKGRDKQREFDQDVFNPPLLRWGVDSIEGLTIDDEEADLELLLASGPPELADEIAEQIPRVMRFSAVEAKN